jgi:hypothetical protein
MSDQLIVQHNALEQQFYIAMDGYLAVLDYVFIDAEKVDINHTFVPPVFRGKGVAEALLNSAVTWMESEGLQVQASCRYAYVKLKRRKLSK